MSVAPLATMEAASVAVTTEGAFLGSIRVRAMAPIRVARWQLRAGPVEVRTMVVPAVRLAQVTRFSALPEVTEYLDQRANSKTSRLGAPALVGNAAREVPVARTRMVETQTAGAPARAVPEALRLYRLKTQAEAGEQATTGVAEAAMEFREAEEGEVQVLSNRAPPT
jgi:hypothetical protein